MSSFAVGDTVRLKSGSPLMTVESIGKDFSQQPQINCVWFEKNQVKRGGFPSATVEKSNDDISLA